MSVANGLKVRQNFNKLIFDFYIRVGYVRFVAIILLKSFLVIHSDVLMAFNVWFLAVARLMNHNHCTTFVGSKGPLGHSFNVRNYAPRALIIVVCRWTGLLDEPGNKSWKIKNETMPATPLVTSCFVSSVWALDSTIWRRATEKRRATNNLDLSGITVCRSTRVSLLFAFFVTVRTSFVATELAATSLFRPIALM